MLRYFNGWNKASTFFIDTKNMESIFSTIMHFQYILVLHYFRKLYTVLIKSNRPIFQLHFSISHILGKYFIFGKTLDIVPHFQYMLILIICHASFRSSERKQCHTLWIRKSCLKCATGNITSTYHDPYSGSEVKDKHSQTLTDHWFERVFIPSSALRVLLNWVSPFDPPKYLALTPRWLCKA